MLHPLWEDSPSPYKIFDDVGQLRPPEEEFPGVHLIEEGLIASPVVGLETPTAFYGSEDFAGSLPLEEPPGWTMSSALDLSVLNLQQMEEFGGAHPLEEPGLVLGISDLIQTGPIQLGEDFAGSLPLEEPPGWVVRVAADLSSQVSLAEDFAGSLPLEEDPARVWHLHDRVRQQPFLPFEIIPQQPLASSLLYAGGADLREDLFFLSDEDFARQVGVEWELGLEGYGRKVSFKDFEQKILVQQTDEEKREGFRQMMVTFGLETEERLRQRDKLIRTTVTVAGVTYVLWKVLVWL